MNPWAGMPFFSLMADPFWASCVRSTSRWRSESMRLISEHRQVRIRGCAGERESEGERASLCDGRDRALEIQELAGEDVQMSDRARLGVDLGPA